MPETGLTIATGSSLALPPRRSNDYKAWLIKALGQLAAYLGQQEALDTEGYRQAEMATDLADTVPSVMEATFARCRRELKFFPVTKEILDLYRLELRKELDRREAEKQAAEQREQEQIALDAREHPEEYISGLKFLSDHVHELKQVGTMENLRRQAAAAPPRITIASPTVSECPHCGGELPHAIADLRGLSAAALRSIAAQRDARAAEIQRALATPQTVAPPPKQLKRKKRKTL